MVVLNLERLVLGFATTITSSFALLYRLRDGYRYGYKSSAAVEFLKTNSKDGECVNAKKQYEAGFLHFDGTKIQCGNEMVNCERQKSKVKNQK